MLISVHKCMHSFRTLEYIKKTNYLTVYPNKLIMINYHISTKQTNILF